MFTFNLSRYSFFILFHNYSGLCVGYVHSKCWEALNCYLLMSAKLQFSIGSHRVMGPPSLPGAGAIWERPVRQQGQLTHLPFSKLVLEYSWSHVLNITGFENFIYCEINITPKNPQSENVHFTYHREHTCVPLHLETPLGQPPIHCAPTPTIFQTSVIIMSFLLFYSCHLNIHSYTL